MDWKKLNKKEENRLKELEDKATKEFIQNSDLSVVEWLNTEKEKQEYLSLYDRFLKAL